MIRLAVSTYLLDHLPIEKRLARFAAMGYRRVEWICFGSKSPDLREWGAERFRALLQKHGMELVAIYPRPIDIHSPEKLAESVEYVEVAIDRAAELGCGRIVFPPLRPREDYDYGQLAESLNELGAYIGARPVSICLENHHDWPLSTAEDYKRLFEKVAAPQIGIALDTGHFTASDVDMPRFVERFRDRIRHVHIKDHIGAESVALGRGKTDNVAVFRKLRKIGYDGFATVEIEPRDPEHLERYVAEAVGYCRDVLQLV